MIHTHRNNQQYIMLVLFIGLYFVPLALLMVCTLLIMCVMLVFVVLLMVVQLLFWSCRCCHIHDVADVVAVVVIVTDVAGVRVVFVVVGGSVVVTAVGSFVVDDRCAVVGGDVVVDVGWFDWHGRADGAVCGYKVFALSILYVVPSLVMVVTMQSTLSPLMMCMCCRQL